MTDAENNTLQQHGLSLNAPEGIQIQTASKVWTRADFRREGVRLPFGLDAHRKLFAPLGPPGQRGTAYVIDLTLSEEARAKVSAQAPLRLTLPADAVGAATDLLPLAYDGEDYLPVGHPLDYEWVGAHSGVPLNLTWLPRHARADGEVGIELVHALRLFIYKKLGMQNKIPCLRRVKRIGKKRVRYAPIRKKAFKKGHRVAVFVHGFASDTEGAILQCARFGPKSKVRLFGQVPNTKCLSYDHLLAFDYEGFGTTIAENGERFLEDLRKLCGFHRGDGIAVDLFTHSMGSIVSRWMIEMNCGDGLIDHLVQSGAPNAGTRLASVSEGLVFLLTMLINLFAPAPPLGAVGTWLVKRFFEEGVGLEDLRPDSDLYRELNRPKHKPLSVSYLTLAGENLLPENRCLLERLWRKVWMGIDKGLDAFYGGQNDAVVPVKSMRKLRKRDYAAVRKANLPCHHYGYFSAVPKQPDGPTKIGKWMCR
jgi:pimeloyl-ACP methyl ester carboxylesterase